MFDEDLIELIVIGWAMALAEHFRVLIGNNLNRLPSGQIKAARIKVLDLFR